MPYMFLERQTLYFSSYKNETVITWSERKKKAFFFELYFALRKISQRFYFILIHTALNKLPEYRYFHILKKHVIRCLFLKSSKNLQCILKVLGFIKTTDPPTHRPLTHLWSYKEHLWWLLLTVGRCSFVTLQLY